MFLKSQANVNTDDINGLRIMYFAYEKAHAKFEI